MTIIWRVENEHGDGPYVGWYNLYPPFASPMPWYHPGPERDSRLNGIEISSHHQFGFACLEDYYRWFNKKHWREWLKQNGYMLCEYHSYDVIFGECQVVFSKWSKFLRQKHDPMAFDYRFGGIWEYR